MRWNQAAAVSLVVLNAVPFLALAQEAAKQEAIRSSLASALPLVPVDFINQKQPNFCRDFLEDFRVQRNIEYVEPIGRADAYDDPVWNPYKQRCPQLALNRLQECEVRVAEAIRKAPQAERQELFMQMCRQYYGTANFKLFRTDIDNNPTNGEEYLFYFERAVGPKNRPEQEQITVNGEYNLIDLKRCEISDAIPTDDPYDYFHGHPVPNYNGIMRYRNKRYVFSLRTLGANWNEKNLAYFLNLYRVEKGDRGSYCAYSSDLRKAKK